MFYTSPKYYVLRRTAVLRSYSDISPVRVDWLWYPYIAYGKITVLQGNPGDGKSHVGIQLAAALSAKGFLPDGVKLPMEEHVIYQCAEDGLADTVKPRLVEAGANCKNIAFLDDDMLTLDDEKVREAMADFHARLLVIDPLQAYLGNSDISSASNIRRIMNRLCKWAGFYNCAVLIIGHLNKNEGANDLYRGLGSIDVTASARSVLQLEQYPEDPDVRVIRQVKSSLARKGDNVLFRIVPDHGIEWLGTEEPSVQTVDVGSKQKKIIESPGSGRRETKQTEAAAFLREVLSNGPMLSSEIEEMVNDKPFGFKTVCLVKNNIGVGSFRKGGRWYWSFPGNPGGEA